MATQQELAEQGKQQAELIVNNSLIDGLTAQLKEKEKYGLAYPKDYNLANALMGGYLVLKETTDKSGKCVLDPTVCSPASVSKTLMDMVTMGLSMQKKQCYPIAYGGRLQCHVSYHGHKVMAHRYGAKTIDAEVIYEGDEFSYHIKDGRKFIDKHIQNFMNINLDKIIGAYCIVKLDDKSTYTEIMNINQIKTAWKKGYGYKDGAGTHKDFTDMMAKKTVTSRACKQIVQQYGDVYAVSSFEDSESTENADTVYEDSVYDIETNANTVDFVDESDNPQNEMIIDELTTEALPDFMKG